MSEIHNNTNKIFLWSLIGVALLIWGNFAYKLVTNIDSSTETTENKPKYQIHKKDTSILDSLFYAKFSGIFRDPFVRVSNSEGDITSYWNNEEYIYWEQPDNYSNDPHPSANLIIYPKIHLLGIIGNTAVLKIDNETLYVKNGDNGLYGAVVEIGSDYIRIKQNEEVVTLVYEYTNALNSASEPKWLNE